MNLSKEQVKTILQNAPQGTSPAGIVAALRQKGYQLEGFDQSSQEPGFFQRVGADISNRQQNINEISKKTQSPVSTNFQIIGQGFGAGADTFAEAGKSVYKTLFPKFLQNIASKIGQKLASDIGSATIAGEGTPTIAELAQKAGGAYNQFAQTHPEAAGNLEAVGNIARLGSEVYGAGKTVDAAVEVGKAGYQAGKQVISNFETNAGQNQLQKVVELTRPILSKEEKQAAYAAEQGTQKGLLRTVTIQPSPRDLEVAQAAQSVVDPSRSIPQNISAINKEISASSKNVITALERNNSIFNKNQLRTFLSTAKDTEERQILLAGDEQAGKAYDGVINTFMRVVNKHPKNLTGLLAARKEFDKVAEAGLKGAFSDGVVTARKQAIRDIRRQANEYIAEHLPAGDALREVLRRQSLLFEARDNLAEKAVANTGTNVVTRAAKAIKKHPVISTAAAAAGGTAAVEGLIKR